MVPLSSGLLVVEKGGLEGFTGGFGLKLSLLTQVMLQRKRDAELGICDFRPRNPRDEKCGGPRGLVDYARSQARSGTFRASTVTWCGAFMELEEFSKVLLNEAWSAKTSLCIT